MVRAFRTSVRRPTVVIAGLALAGATAIGAGAATAGAQSSRTSARPAGSGQWLQPAGNFSSTRFSPLTRINSGNASKLQVAWTLSLGTDRGLEGQPLVVGDTMYTVSAYPNYVRAINLRTDALKWTYVPPEQLAHPWETKPAAANTACCDLVNRGPAFAHGMLYFLTLDGHVTALNAATGKVVWNVQNANPKIAQTGTAAPLVIHNEVIAEMSGNEFGVRGYLTAYNAFTGKRLWRVFNCGTDSQIGATPQFIKKFGRNSSLKTWPNMTAIKHGGCAAWAWMSFDPKLNLLYNTIGNPAPWNPSQRPGDNKWAESVTARNPDTGKLIWAYQFTTHDNWDYDSTQEAILFTAHIGGKAIPAMAHFDKNGFAYVLNRATGQLLAAHPYYVNENTVLRVNMKTGRPVYNRAKLNPQGKTNNNECPWAMGAKDEQPSAFDPQTGLFYIPTNNGCQQWTSMHVDFQGGEQPFVGAIVRMFRGPGGFGGAFEAYNPLTGKISFMDKEPWPVWSGVLTTAGGVAFYGTLDGFFKAVNERTGKLLFKFRMPSGVIGDPIAYTTPSGEEQIAIYAGVGGWPAEFIPLMNHNPTGELGAVNYYGFGRCAAFDHQCQRPLQDVVTLGGDLIVFHLPHGAAGSSSAAGAAPASASGPSTGLLAGGGIALLAAVILAFLMGRLRIPAVRRRGRYAWNG
jgi:PQQ-dependent dehydrogenase (methanol/ethanol family)